MQRRGGIEESISNCSHSTSGWYPTQIRSYGIYHPTCFWKLFQALSSDYNLKHKEQKELSFSKSPKVYHSLGLGIPILNPPIISIMMPHPSIFSDHCPIDYTWCSLFCLTLNALKLATTSHNFLSLVIFLLFWGS